MPRIAEPDGTALTGSPKRMPPIVVTTRVMRAITFFATRFVTRFATLFATFMAMSVAVLVAASNPTSTSDRVGVAAAAASNSDSVSTPPPAHDRAFWWSIAKQRYAVPDGESAAALAQELSGLLGSPDPDAMGGPQDDCECGRRAKVSPLCLHDLGRTFATRAASGGYPMPMLTDILGHSSMETTSVLRAYEPSATGGCWRLWTWTRPHQAQGHRKGHSQPVLARTARPAPCGSQRKSVIL